MSWYQILTIRREAVQAATDEEHRRGHPIACPLCGEPMRAGPDGHDFCPWGDFRPDGAPLLPSS